MMFPERVEHLLNKIDEIERGEINIEDIVNSFVVTTGIIELCLEMEEEGIINVFDIGGKRNERKKWIHTFEDVSLVIFPVSLTNFFKDLSEDENINAMEEDLALWREIVNSKWFNNTKFILWFSHSDQFELYLRKNINLFNEFIGHSNDDKGEDSIEKCFDLIKKKFLEKVEPERSVEIVSSNLLDTLQFFRIIKDKMKFLFDVELSEPKNYGILTSKKCITVNFSKERLKYFSIA
eukprot:TRINITY_DN2146_c0_g1_i2.p1 TRINITY_DN2146_c0_g1~~TRINITY_DN2146_c0_g1_i2.p1  ORF type:complete len:236 (-),score=55.15 TRINITY_DN2146_c0_g1_i2:27-734(-)